jgi:hypothetical protein
MRSRRMRKQTLLEMSWGASEDPSPQTPAASSAQPLGNGGFHLPGFATLLVRDGRYRGQGDLPLGEHGP